MSLPAAQYRLPKRSFAVVAGASGSVAYRLGWAAAAVPNQAGGQRALRPTSEVVLLGAATEVAVPPQHRTDRDGLAVAAEPQAQFRAGTSLHSATEHLGGTRRDQRKDGD